MEVSSARRRPTAGSAYLGDITKHREDALIECQPGQASLLLGELVDKELIRHGVAVGQRGFISRSVRHGHLQQCRSLVLNVYAREKGCQP